MKIEGECWVIVGVVEAMELPTEVLVTALSYFHRIVFNESQSLSMKKRRKDGENRQGREGCRQDMDWRKSDIFLVSLIVSINLII